MGLSPDLACRCPRCGDMNHCAVAQPGRSGASCWCQATNFSAIAWPAAPHRCLCSGCVTAMQKKEQETRHAR